MELTLSKIVRWAVGLLLLLAAVGALIQGSYIAFFIYIVTAIICIPVTANAVESQINIKMSGAVRFLVVFVLLLIGGMALASSDSPNDTSKVSTPATQVSNVAVEHKEETPAQSSTPQVVGSWSGNGIKTTDTFHVSSEKWTIRWDTKSGEYGDMNFIIYVYKDNGSLKDLAANVIGASNDKTIMRGSGDYYLKIVTSQPYTVEVVA
jgi:hypothetical protein